MVWLFGKFIHQHPTHITLHHTPKWRTCHITFQYLDHLSTRLRRYDRLPFSPLLTVSCGAVLAARFARFARCDGVTGVGRVDWSEEGVETPAPFDATRKPCVTLGDSGPRRALLRVIG